MEEIHTKEILIEEELIRELLPHKNALILYTLICLKAKPYDDEKTGLKAYEVLIGKSIVPRFTVSEYRTAKKFLINKGLIELIHDVSTVDQYMIDKDIPRQINKRMTRIRVLNDKLNVEIK